MRDKRLIFSVGQAAEICQVAPREIRRWFDAGRIRGYRIPGTQDRRIPRDNLLQFLKGHEMWQAIVRLERLYPTDPTPEHLVPVMQEIFDLRTENARLRAREQYVKHLPGCESIRRSFRGCQACQPIPQDAHSTYQVFGKCPHCDGPVHVWSVTRSCTCGLDSLKGATQ